MLKATLAGAALAGMLAAPPGLAQRGQGTGARRSAKARHVDPDDRRWQDRA